MGLSYALRSGGCRYCAGRTRLDEWEGGEGEGFWGGGEYGASRFQGMAGAFRAQREL